MGEAWEYFQVPSVPWSMRRISATKSCAIFTSHRNQPHQDIPTNIVPMYLTLHLERQRFRSQTIDST